MEEERNEEIEKKLLKVKNIEVDDKGIIHFTSPMDLKDGDNVQIVDDELVRVGEGMLPEVGSSYAEQSKEDITPSLPARIPNALAENIAASLHSIEKKFQLPTAAFAKESVDRYGNLVKLSAMQNRIIFSIAAQLFSKDSPIIAEYLDKLQRGEEPRENVREYIVLDDICEDVMGKEERRKSRWQDKIYEELRKICERKQMQVYYGGEIIDEKGNRHDLTITDFQPYLSLTGRERQIQIDEGKRTATAVEMEFTRIFFEKNWRGKGGRYYVLPRHRFDYKTPNGITNKTEVFWTGLLPLTMQLSWSHYNNDLTAAKKQIKEKGIIDREKIAQLKEDALTHTPISFQRVKDAIAFNSSHPQQIARFNKYLWEGLWSLIDGGVLTEKTHIDWEKETITLVYNETKEPLNQPNTKEEDKKRPGGEWAVYAPNKKRGRKKKS